MSATDLSYDALSQKPVRVQLSRASGWRMPANAVSVARPTRWGNPFYVSRWRDAATCVALYRDALRGVWNPATSAHLPAAWSGYSEHQAFLTRMGPRPLEQMQALRGKSLACWCKLGDPCHTDVLLELLNPQPLPDQPSAARGLEVPGLDGGLHQA